MDVGRTVDGEVGEEGMRKYGEEMGQEVGCWIFGWGCRSGKGHGWNVRWRGGCRNGGVASAGGRRQEGGGSEGKERKERENRKKGRGWRNGLRAR